MKTGKKKSMPTVDARRDGILRVAGDGRLTTEDDIAFVPHFERLARAANPILMGLGPSFARWTLGALWRSVEFDALHLRQFGRMAVVGDKKWQEWEADASNLVFPGEARFFERDAIERAKAWLRNPDGERET